MGYLYSSSERFNYFDAFVDSRGIELNIGDMVLGLSLNNFTEFYFGEVVKEDRGNGLMTKYRNSFGKPNYEFKLDKNLILDIKTYFNKLGIKVNYFTNYYEILGRDIYKSLYEEYRKLHNGSLRGMKMIEITGQDLLPGDLVIYRDDFNVGKYHSHTFRYGIVISDTKVYTESNTLQRVFFVYKLVNYTDKENVLLDTLSINYQQNLVKKSNNYNIGDVYISGKTYYMYLGKINLEVNHLKASNVLYNVKLEKDKEYWFKFNSLPDSKNLLDLVSKNIAYNCEISLNKEYLNEFFYYNYSSIDKLKSFVIDLPKNAYFNFNLPLNNFLEFKVYKEEFYTMLFKLNFV